MIGTVNSGNINYPCLKQTKTVTGSTTSNQTVSADKNYMLSKVTVNPVPGSQLGNATAQDVMTGKTFSSSAGVNIAGTGTKKPAIYGITWPGTNTQLWTRTDDAASFFSPRPYYAGGTGTPSSPFDTIMPWAGMRRVTDSVAGELVEIPKYYYKWTKSGSALQLQISSYPVDGFYVSPAHMDRNDGFGERDYVYVSRYHVNSSYKSVTGAVPKGNATISTFRNGIANLRADIWQIDFTMYWTIYMLYLVEYANWDYKNSIGLGLELTDPPSANGGCDNMPYHTGTMAAYTSSRGSNQYRYISDFHGQQGCFIDGFCGGYMVTQMLTALISNPNYFDENITSAYSHITGFNESIPFTDGAYAYLSSFELSTDVHLFVENGGMFQFLYPSGTVSNESYTKMEYMTSSKGMLVHINGLSYFSMSWNSSDKWPTIGSRLMVLPTSRL